MDWRAGSHDALSIDFVVGYSYDFPQLPEYVEFYRKSGMSAPQCLQINGFRKHTRNELRHLLENLKIVGVTEIGMSLYGLGASHDAFAGRDGDFEYLLAIAREVAGCGMVRFETLFLRKGSMNEIPCLLAELDAIPGCGRRYLVPWDFRGRGKLMEQHRPETLDIETLPDAIASLVNRRSYRPEAEWLPLIESGCIPDKQFRHFLVSIWEENLEELETADCDAIIARLRCADDAFHAHMPPLRELAALFGERSNQKIYALRDLEWKWQDLYLDQHPGLKGVRRFDDLRSGALRK